MLRILCQDGTVDFTRLKKKWWEQMRGGGACKGLAGASAQMSVGALAGLFMMVILGRIVSGLIAVCEFTWRKRKLAVDDDVSNYFATGSFR